jgi:hypothetical protein
MKLMKLLNRIFHQNSKKDSKKDPRDVDRGSYYLMCTHDNLETILLIFVMVNEYNFFEETTNCKFKKVLLGP